MPDGTAAPALPRLSVVIPTYNRRAQLAQVLQALERQTLAPADFEVVVVSDGANDGTDAFVAGLATPLDLRLVVQVNSGVAVARNAGVAQARAALILFLDDDVVPAPECLAEHLDAHARNGDDVVVIGTMLTPADFRMLPWVAWEQRRILRQYDDMLQGRWAPTPRQFFTGNASLARRHLLTVGGFDPQFRRAEDLELAYRLDRLGLRFIFHPAAAGYHYAVRSFRSWMETPYAYGRNDVIFGRDQQHHWLIAKIVGEYRGRHPVVHLLVGLCLGRAWLLQLVYALVCTAVLLATKFGLDRPAEAGLSCLFNLRYYQGFADELGGRAAFFALYRQPGAVREHVA